MKRIITSAIAALLLSLGSVLAQNIAHGAVYVINQKIVPGFDGSQLQNKTIASYEVDPEYGIHVIYTSDYTKENKISSTKILSESGELKVVAYDAKGNEVSSSKVMINPYLNILDDNGILYVVDGNISTPAYAKSVSPDKVVSVKIIKDTDDPMFKMYSANLQKQAGRFPDSITLIDTNSDNATVLVVDGSVVSSEEFKKISPSKIQAVTVFKQKSDPTFVKYAKKGTNTVMVVSTK